MDSHLSARDPQLVLNIVNHLKSQGIFDQFRRECLADIDTKPSFQNLRQRVEGYVSKFLSQQTWKPDLNKNQLRDSLRKHINDSGMLSIGVEHLVDQVVNPKVNRTFLPQVESVVRQYLGLERPADSAAGSDKREEVKETAVSFEPSMQDAQRVVAKIETPSAERTPEISITPEVLKREQEREGSHPVGTGETALNIPPRETRLSEVSASTESSPDLAIRTTRDDSVLIKQGDSTPETKKQISDAQQSTEDSIKNLLVTPSTTLPVEPDTNIFDASHLVKERNQDDGQNIGTIPEMYDDNSVSCADSIDGESKLIINEDSIMSETNIESEDVDVTSSQNKNTFGVDSNTQNSCSASWTSDNIKTELEEVKFDLKNLKDICPNPDTNLEAKQKDLKSKTLVKKEPVDTKEDKSVKDAHKKHEKERSPSKHKSSKSSESVKPRQSTSKHEAKHKSSTLDKHKGTDKIHKHSSSSKSSRPDSKSSKSHSEHKSKSSASKLEQKHKSSHSSSSKSHDKVSKPSDPLSSSSSKPSSSSSNTKSDKHDSEKKSKSSKDGSVEHRHKSSGGDPKLDKSKSSSKESNKSSKLSEEKSKSNTKYSDGKSFSSEKHKSSESSKSQDKYKSKESSKHSSSSKVPDKLKHRDSSNKSDSRYVKKKESSSKEHSRSSKPDEKKVPSKKLDDVSPHSSQDVAEKSSNSENSNTSDSNICEINKSGDPSEGKDHCDTSNKRSTPEKEVPTEEVSELECSAPKSVVTQDIDIKHSSCEKLLSNADIKNDSEVHENVSECNEGERCLSETYVNVNEKQAKYIPDIEVKDDSSSSLHIVEPDDDSVKLDTPSEEKLKPDIVEDKEKDLNDFKEAQKSEHKEQSADTGSDDIVASSSSSMTKCEIKDCKKEDTDDHDSEPDQEREDLMKSLVLQKSEDESGSILEGHSRAGEGNMAAKKGEEDKKSDITVSSVHTSDLSSYDDQISLSSSDELQAVESLNPTVKDKKVALKEIKEVAATYLKSRTNSSGRSTPLFPSGDDDTNQSLSKQRVEKSKTETESSTKNEEDGQHSDDEDGVRGSSRFGRQRKANPKYASEEYIFNSSWKEVDHSPASVTSVRRTSRRSADDSQKPMAKSGSISTTSESFHSTKILGRKRRWSKTSDKTQKDQAEMASDNSGEVSVPSKSTENPPVAVEGSSRGEVATRAKRRRGSSRSPEHGKTRRAENKRYSSSDLYKPRPVIGARRHRTVEEASNNEQSQDETSQEQPQKRPRGRPRKRPTTPEPQPASLAKRKR